MRINIIRVVCVCFLALLTTSLFSQKNRYGMLLTGTAGSYSLTDAAKICPIIPGGCEALPVDAFVEYPGYSPSLISNDDYTQCTTLKYTFKTYATYSLTLEVDIPKLTTGPHPFIIWVHGGGWTGGGVTNFSNQSAYLASRGIAGVRISYSLIAQGGKFEMGMQELADAFAFVKDHAAEWGLDMTRYGYAGGSAGTPLSSLAAMKQNGNGCKLYIGCNGIYDFQNNLAGSFGSGASGYLTSYPTKESRTVISAINYIPTDPANIPAVAVFHGTGDFTISYLQSLALCDSIVKKGGHAEKNIYDYYVHAFFNIGSTDKFEDVTIKMYTFAKSIFGTPDVIIPHPTLTPIARYTFNTGANQIQPIDVAKGITVSDFTIGSPITSKFIGDALETSGWGSLNISANKYIGFEIKSNPTCSFTVNQIDLKIKKTTSSIAATGIFNYGPTFPPITTRGIQKTGIATTTYGVGSLLPNATTAAQSSGSLCFGIGLSTGTSTTEVLSIDEVTVYGQVVKPSITVPTLLPDASSKSVLANKGNSIVIPISVWGEMIENTVQVSIEGDKDGYFSVDRDYATVSELSIGKKLNISFTAEKVGMYSATLKLQSDEVSLLIPVSVNCNILFEDFSEVVGNSATTIAGLKSIPANLPQAKTVGWEGFRMYEYKAGAPNLGSVCLGSTIAEQAFLKTPLIDLREPYVLKLKARSLTSGAKNGNFSVVSDKDGLVFKDSNTTGSFKSFTSEPMVGSINNRLIFKGEKDSTNNIIIDSVYIGNTSLPTIGLGLERVIDFDSIPTVQNNTLEIPLIGFNLAHTISLTLKSDSPFSLISPNSISSTSAQAGTSISLQFNEPIASGVYIDTLTVSSSDFVSRKLILKGLSKGTTLILEKFQPRILVQHDVISIFGVNGAKVTLINIVGEIIYQANNIENCTISQLNKGIYFIRLANGNKTLVKKLIIK